MLLPDRMAAERLLEDAAKDRKYESAARLMDNVAHHDKSDVGPS
ncbi:MAG: hypothetical protein U0V73_12145 [Acidimicrobiia bacterium]